MEMLLISHSTGDICPHPQCCAEFPPKLSGYTARGFLMALRFLEGLLPAGKCLRDTELWAQQVLEVQSPVLSFKDAFCRA